MKDREKQQLYFNSSPSLQVSSQVSSHYITTGKSQVTTVKFQVSLQVTCNVLVKSQVYESKCLKSDC